MGGGLCTENRPSGLPAFRPFYFCGNVVDHRLCVSWIPTTSRHGTESQVAVASEGPGRTGRTPPTDRLTPTVASENHLDFPFGDKCDFKVNSPCTQRKPYGWWMGG